MLAVLRGKPTLVLCMSMWWTRREGGKRKDDMSIIQSLDVEICRTIMNYMWLEKNRKVFYAWDVDTSGLSPTAKACQNCSPMLHQMLVPAAKYTYQHIYEDEPVLRLHGKLCIIIRDLSVSFHDLKLLVLLVCGSFIFTKSINLKLLFPVPFLLSSVPVYSVYIRFRAF